MAGPDFTPGFSSGFSGSGSSGVSNPIPNFAFLGNPLTPVFFFPGIQSKQNQNLTTLSVLQLPVNCVLDGQQREPVSKLMGLDGAISGPLKGIFGE